MDHKILKFNKQFVEERRYEQFITSKYPDRKIAIVSCMDTRLVELRTSGYFRLVFLLLCI